MMGKNLVYDIRIPGAADAKILQGIQARKQRPQITLKVRVLYTRWPLKAEM